MQVMITCPVDGPIEVSIEDIDTVVLREPEEAEVVFSCPECGEEISILVRIPSFLMAAIEAMADDTDSYVAPLASLVAMAAEADRSGEPAVSVGVPPGEDAATEAYCEYFRRQLADVSCVDDVLREMGCTGES